MYTCTQHTGWPEWIHLKSSLIANKSVFGAPLNKFTPDLPKQMTTSDLLMIIVATIPSNVSPLLGKNIGQYGAEGHLGTTKVPKAAVSCACLNTLGTKHTGRHQQLFSPSQLQVNVSTASDPGFQNRELNLGNCVLKQLANLSTV